MKIIADFHIHSRFSMATSSKMDVETLAPWAEKKGINLLGTGDFTHPAYFKHLRSRLEEAENGLYRLKNTKSKLRFILTGEISNIYTQDGRGRRIHILIFAPSFEIAENINSSLAGYGNLSSNGRPILGISARMLTDIIFGISPDCFIIPAHVWTPWYSLFGSRSGFDSIEECFGYNSRFIYALETGLSSDPDMNWRISKLDRFTLVSNSDAHSPSKIGREANVFDSKMDYYEITRIIREKDRKGFLYTIEFFPEKGKYHFDGHRKCETVLSPKESIKNRDICPNCKKPLTIGVMHRIEELSDRPEGFVPQDFIPFKRLIPLDEIIALTLGKGVNTKAVKDLYELLIKEGETEFNILMELSKEELCRIAPLKVAEGIISVREGRARVLPGYDGRYGEIRIDED